MNKTTTLVSVIIPTYNRPEKLTKAIDSVLSQSYSNVEVIVVDDNGLNTPNQLLTRKEVEPYLTLSNFKYIPHKVNINGSAARNTGVRFSKGDFLMFLDDDDEFLPTKVEAQLNKLLTLDSTWGACYTKVIYKDGDDIRQRSKKELDGELLSYALGRNLFIAAGSNLMIKRKIFTLIGGFDESFKRNQDLELLTKILNVSKLAFVNVDGLIVYMHKYSCRTNFIDITERYYSTFHNVIMSQDLKKQNEINQLINLQVFRWYLSNKMYKKSFLLIKGKYVNIIEATFYLFHLLNRAINKSSCSYIPKFNGKFDFCLNRNKQ